MDFRFRMNSTRGKGPGIAECFLYLSRLMQGLSVIAAMQCSTFLASSTKVTAVTCVELWQYFRPNAPLMVAY